MRPASQLLAGTFPPTTSDVSQALSKVVEDEHKQRDAEAEFKRSQTLSGKPEWFAAPTMSSYCGYQEAEGIYYINEVRNAERSCPTHDPSPLEEHRCADCVHAQHGEGPAHDEFREHAFVDLTARNVSAGVEHDTTGGLLDKHREGASARKALELAAAYQTRGQLLNRPDYLAWCSVFSSRNLYSTCVFQNPHQNCPAWQARDELAADGPAGDDEARPRPGWTPMATPAAPATGLTSFLTQPPPASAQKKEPLMTELDEAAAGGWSLAPELADRIAAAFEWIAGLDSSPQRRQQLVRGLHELWPSLDETGVKNLMSVVELQEAAQTQGPDASELARETYQPEFVAQLRSNGDLFSQTVIRFYDEVNPPLAPGDPPLTQEIADAYLSILSFVDALMENRAWQPMNPGVRMLFTQQMAAGYADLSPIEQQWLATQPLEWAKTRVLWQAATEPDRLTLRDQLVAYYGETAQSTPVLDQPTPVLRPPVFGAPRRPDPHTAEPLVEGGGQQTHTLMTSIIDAQKAEEERLKQQDPELALQVKLQNQVANASMISNIMKMQHDASMSIIRNITA